MRPHSTAEQSMADWAMDHAAEMHVQATPEYKRLVQQAKDGMHEGMATKPARPKQGEMVTMQMTTRLPKGTKRV